MSRTAEEAQARQRLEFLPGQLAGDLAGRTELTARHRPVGAGELQGNLLATTEAMT